MQAYSRDLEECCVQLPYHLFYVINLAPASFLYPSLNSSYMKVKMGCLLAVPAINPTPIFIEQETRSHTKLLPAVTTIQIMTKWIHCNLTNPLGPSVAEGEPPCLVYTKNCTKMEESHSQFQKG